MNSLRVIMGMILYTKRVDMQLRFSHVVHNKLSDHSGDGKQDEFMDFKAESGRRLKLAREAKAWTLREVVAQIKGISESRLSNYEQGLRLMRQPEAIKLASVLGVSAAYLMCVDEGSELPLRKQRLLALFDASDNRGKRTIEQAAETQASYNIKQVPSQSFIQNL
jgi:transcriptional regulator with XRE-family HTH domain